jgi:hypothetical protein
MTMMDSSSLLNAPELAGAVAHSADWTASAVSMWSVSPWAFVALSALVTLCMIVRELLKNTALTQAILRRSDVIDEIRTDQIKSNTERKEQAVKIDAMDSRITSIERDLRSLNCMKCEN